MSKYNILEKIKNLTSCFDGEVVSYGDSDKFSKFIDNVNKGVERDALNFTRDMYIAMRHENEQEENIYKAKRS